MSLYTHLSPLAIADTTDATSTITGSTQILGGIGIAKSLFVGTGASITSIADQTLKITSNLSTYNSLATFFNTSGSLITSSILVGTAVSTNNSAIFGFVNSGSGSTSNYLTLGLSGFNDIVKVYGTNVLITPTVDSTSITSGALQLAGGLGIAKSLYVSGITVVTGTNFWVGGVGSGLVRTASSISDYSVFGTNVTDGTSNTRISLSGNTRTEPTYGSGSISYYATSATGQHAFLTLGGSTVSMLVNSSSTSIPLTTTLGTTVNTTSSTGGALNVSGDIVLAATTPRIVFPSFSSGPPTFTNRSVGTKLVLYGAIGSSAVDYAIGIENGGLWNSITTSASGNFFKWYGGTTNIMQLETLGNLTLTNPGTAIAVPLQILTPSLATGNFATLQIGVAAASNQCARMYFNYVGSGLTTNSLGLGLWNSPQMTIDGNGTVIAPSTIDSTSLTTGGLQVKGGLSIAKSLSIGSSMYVSATPVYPPGPMTADSTVLSGYAYGNGTYVASTDLETTPAYLAFDKTTANYLEQNNNYNSATGAYTASTSTNGYLGGYVQLVLPVSIVLVSFSLIGRSGFETLRSPRDFQVFGSNDGGTTWTSILTSTGNTNWVAATPITFTVNASTAYLAFRLVANTVGNFTSGSVNENCLDIAEWVLQGASILSSNGLSQYSSTYDSTSSTTGALQIAGGVGITKNLNIGTSSIPVGLTTELGGTTPLINFEINFHSAGKNTTYGGAALRIDTRTSTPGFNWFQRAAGSTVEVNPISIDNTGAFIVYTTTDSTSTTTGALQVKGGVGIAKTLYVGSGVIAPNLGSLRNRVINGDIRIDQRNSGASVTIAASGVYYADRWRIDTNMSFSGATAQGLKRH
ncbi:unnamed protein product [Sphagnum tenellum]